MAWNGKDGETEHALERGFTIEVDGHAVPGDPEDHKGDRAGDAQAEEHLNDSFGFHPVNRG